MRTHAPLKILVVDDEADAREFVQLVLTDAGHMVTTAAGGHPALVYQDRFDVLLTDLMMPAMTGDELARQMRRRHPDLKVLYLTGYADRLFAEKQVLWEGEAFLEKPASPRGLIEAIEMLVTGKFETPRNTADNNGT